MKKVGIITFYNAHNYGAMLQAYALQEYISSLKEYDAYIINYRNNVIDKRYSLYNWNGNKIKALLKNVAKFISYRKQHNNRKISFEDFLNKKFKLTSVYRNEEELKKCNYFDAYITGSDQVWNKEITHGLKDSYTLNFAPKETKKIAYAASIGNSITNDKDKATFKDKLACLDYISVREKTAKKELEQIIDKQISVTIDPTLLPSRDFWEKEVQKNSIKEKYIFAYQVEDNIEYVKTVNYISKITGLKVIHFEKRNNHYDKILKNAYESGPTDFITLIKNAEYVISTSFHGTVFSTIFHKNFLVIPHKTRGSRMIDYLKSLNLENRIIKKFDKEKIYKEINTKINYKKVDEILEIERKKSQDFLKKALGGK